MKMSANLNRLRTSRFAAVVVAIWFALREVRAAIKAAAWRAETSL
jgi:hypothetical protein